MTVGAMGHEVKLRKWADWEYQPQIDVRELHITDEQFAQALKNARSEAANDYGSYGFHLWRNLVIGQQAYIVASERLVDRLPPNAFGQVGPLAFTQLVLNWSRYRAPDEAASVLAFKTQALASGWKPAQANSYLLALRGMEQAMPGGWRAGDADPMAGAEAPAGLVLSSLDRRQLSVFEHMRANPAFPG